MNWQPFSTWPETISVPTFQKSVLAWYEKNARDLPWRRTSDPYKIWISEVMLQQTQVVTVIPYWNRFVESFPTAADLAAADEAEVLKHWEGLGYYRRARQLHAAAKKIVEEFQGNFPTDFKSVLSLPGIGRYTASAILSISQDSPLPILEGNTIRLFSRLSGLQEDPTTSKNQKALWQISEQTVSRDQTGSFNQGLMEIGATICKVSDPDCKNCPLKNFCVAKKESLQKSIPAPKEKKIQYESVCHSVVVVERKNRFLLRKCQKGEFFEGLWDFPRMDVSEKLPSAGGAKTLDLSKIIKDKEMPLVAAEAQQTWCEAELGLDVGVDISFEHFRHAVTKYRILLLVFRCDSVKGELSTSAKKNGWQWFTSQQLAEMPLSATGRKIFKKLFSK